jgi:hypothetical protein
MTPSHNLPPGANAMSATTLALVAIAALVVAVIALVLVLNG